MTMPAPDPVPTCDRPGAPRCTEPVTWVCRCSRCDPPPGTTDTYYACKAHRAEVGAVHRRVRERSAEWMTYTPQVAVPVPLDILGPMDPTTAVAPVRDCVIQDWVMTLPYKMQTVMLLALRGCDTAPKHAEGKDLTRALRGVVLKNASNKSGFIRRDCPFLSMDACEGMPVHWMMHLIHGIEVVGYFHPDRETRVSWHQTYLDAIHKLHVAPESRAAMIVRLAGDNGPKIEE